MWPVFAVADALKPISAAHRKLSASTKLLSRSIAEAHSVNVTAAAAAQQATVVYTEEEWRKIIELDKRLLAERYLGADTPYLVESQKLNTFCSGFLGFGS